MLPIQTWSWKINLALLCCLIIFIQMNAVLHEQWVFLFFLLVCFLWRGVLGRSQRLVDAQSKNEHLISTSSLPFSDSLRRASWDRNSRTLRTDTTEASVFSLPFMESTPSSNTPDMNALTRGNTFSHNSTRDENTVMENIRIYTCIFSEVEIFLTYM